MSEPTEDRPVMDNMEINSNEAEVEDPSRVAEPSATNRIKKRVASATDFADAIDPYEDEDGDLPDAGRSSSASATSGRLSGKSEVEFYENQARKELHDFLTKKGVDVATEAKGYKVHINFTQASRRRSELGGGKAPYTVSYTGPDGEFLQARGDILTAIKTATRRGSSASSARRPIVHSRPRDEIFLEAHDHFESTVTNGDMPLDINGIRVLSFGHIYTRTSLFHSQLEIFPVGYQAEITARSSPSFESSMGLSDDEELEMFCEVVNKDGLPEFRLSIKGNERTTHPAALVMIYLLSHYLIPIIITHHHHHHYHSSKHQHLHLPITLSLIITRHHSSLITHPSPEYHHQAPTTPSPHIPNKQYGKRWTLWVKSNVPNRSSI